MYHPQHNRGQQQRTHHTEQGHVIRAVLRVLTVVFWVALPIFVVLIAVSAFIESIGALQSLITGISLLVVVLSSGAIAWVEFRSNTLDDTEREEWTTKVLFFGLVFGFTVSMAALYFAP